MSEYKYRKCPDCFGILFDLSMEYATAGNGRCAECNGTGNDQDFLANAMHNTIYHDGSKPTCLTCNGSKRCRTCRGKGKLKNKEPKEESFKAPVQNNDEKLNSPARTYTPSSAISNYSGSYYPSRKSFWGKVASSLGQTISWILVGALFALIVQIGSCTVVAIASGKAPSENHYSMLRYVPPGIFLIGGAIGVVLAIRVWIKK